jgi:hypothetical protein
MPIDNNYGIYYETQSNDMCRMHSLNAYFGYSKISINDYRGWINTYDDYIKKRFNVRTSSTLFDLTNSDQTNLVSFILKQYKIHTRYYALNNIYSKVLDIDILRASYIFVYNPDHIWGIRLINNEHYKVDSLGGVTPFNINNLTHIKNIGILVPVPLKYEWSNKVELIKSIMCKEGIETKQQLCDYLRYLHSNNNVLGELEIPLGVAMSILETNMPSIPIPEFKQISDLIKKYIKFLSIFTDGNYNKIDFIIRYIPDIIFELISLKK